MIKGIVVVSLATLALTGEALAQAPSQPGSSAGRPGGAETQGLAGSMVNVFDVAHGGVRALRATEANAFITAYWTEERRAAAIPQPMTPPPAASLRQHVPMPSGQAPALVAPPRGPQETRAERRVVSFTHAVGKVFYTNPTDGKDYQCSASSINSPKRRLVWTAGHCVHGGPGGNWMTNWAFQPGYQRGTGPNGVFPYYQLWAQSGWWAKGDTHFDYGVGITWNNAAGRRIGDAVGGHGLIVNPGRPFVAAIGYPSNVLEGETQTYCQAQLSRRSLFNSDQELPCDRRQGASGEPFLKDYNNNSGLGYIVSNGSYIIGNGKLYGPYYDNDTRALYNAAENASPP